MSCDQTDPVTLGLRASARRLVGVAVFSGVINLLTLSGSLYMLQVYDRVIPSRNVATLVGLSLIVLLAYVMQGYFDALRTRMLSRIATLFDAGLQEPIHLALATLPLRGATPLLAQQPLRDLEQIRAFLSGIGPTAFLDMPWIPLFLIALFVFHPAIGMAAITGVAAIIAMTFVTERQSRGAARIATESSAQRQVLADATRRNAEVIRALGMTHRLTARWSQANERFLQENVRAADVHANLGAGAKMLRYALQSAILGTGAYLVVIGQASGGVMIASSIMMGRALAPIEVALSTWKQLAAARQGIARLRDILASTAASSVPSVALPPPRRELCGPRSHRRGAGHRTNDHFERLVLADGRHGPRPPRGERIGQDLADEGAGRRLAGQSAGRSVWTAPRSTSGTTTSWAAISAISRRTWPCSTVRSRKTLRVSTTGRAPTPFCRQPRWRARTT